MNPNSNLADLELLLGLSQNPQNQNQQNQQLNQFGNAVNDFDPMQSNLFANQNGSGNVMPPGTIPPSMSPSLATGTMNQTNRQLNAFSNMNQSPMLNRNNQFNFMLQQMPEAIRPKFTELMLLFQQGRIDQTNLNMAIQQLHQTAAVQIQHMMQPNNMLGGSTFARSNTAPANLNLNIKRGGSASTNTDQPPMKRMRNDNTKVTNSSGNPSTKPPSQGSRSLSVPSAAPASRTQQQPGVELDLEDMMDVTNYTGVDLKEEEFTLNDMGGSGYQYSEDRFREVPFLNPAKVEEIALSHALKMGIEEIDESFLVFCSQAAQVYIVELLEEMCRVAEFRMTVDYNIFKDQEGDLGNADIILDIEEMDDVRGLLVEMETRERALVNALFANIGPRPTGEEEEEGYAGSMMAGPEGTSGMSSAQSAPSGAQPSKKGKSSAKKDLPEAVKNKLTNYAAMMAVGGTMKSWMLPGASLSTSSAAPQQCLPSARNAAKNNTTVASSFTSQGGRTDGPLGSAQVRAGYRGNRPIQKRITIKDALLVMESQKHLKSSELFYRWLANIK